VAEALARRGVPFAFASGYGDLGAPHGMKHRPMLQKPFRKTDLATTIRAALDAGGDPGAPAPGLS
jgi:hypothetical protein